MMLVLAGTVIIAFVMILAYNSLISQKNEVQNVFASVDALLKKRYDLIPNLISTVQNYMQYEKGTLKEITELRARAVSGQLSNDEKVEVENKLSKALGGIMVAVENYPDLKANQNFLQLQAALNEVEEQISAARRAYNAAVRDYNNSVQMFPSTIVASILNFKSASFFAAKEMERENVNAGELFKKQ
ncbi:MAG: LemA family protein [Candidatus Omnitrophica bacterium]|nr:LemA family protein [Candidatus Omnitrophota bacterium]